MRRMQNGAGLLLVVPRLNMGGAETYVATLAPALQARGIRVVVASGGGRLADRLSAAGIRHYQVPIRWSTPLATLLLGAIIRTENIVLVHANANAAAHAVAPACARQSVPWVFTAHGILPREEHADCLSSVSRVMCVSHFLEGWLRAHGPFPHETLVTVPCAVDSDHFTSDADAVRLREAWGVPPDAFTLGILSRLSKRILRSDAKGHGDLFRVLAEFPWAAQWHLVVAGAGPGLRAVRRQAARLGVAARVHCVGHVLDQVPLLHAIDVLTLPSRFETFGLSLLEGMAAGRPTVAYAVGGTPEVVADGETGFLVPPGDVAAFAERLRRLAEHPMLGVLLGDAGRARARRLFPVAGLLDTVMAVYADVLRAHATEGIPAWAQL
jgi:glycosyltransferase involved in cell wall biosynthesis